MRALLASFAVLVVFAARVEPHTLDEYLQATRIDITQTRIVVDLALTPGVAVASKVFAMVDGDGDGRVSPQEIQAYAGRLLRDLALRVDGQPHSLTLTRAECPPWDEIRDGAGTIRLQAAAEVSLTPLRRHRIHYENMHDTAAGVYLVNALTPSTRAIAIAAQHRDALQRRIDLDVDVSTSSAAVYWFVLSVVGLTAISMRLRA